MKTLFVLLMLLLSAGMFPGCAAPNRGHLVNEARDLDARFLAAFNRGNADEVMANYWKSPHLVLVSPDGHLTEGWPAARDVFAKMLADFRGAKMEILDPQYELQDGLVYGWGSWRLTVPSTSGGAPQEVRGVYSQISARRDGRLVYILDHPSITMPPPASAPAR